MSAHYGQFKLNMNNAPTLSVGELRELALEASEKVPSIQDFEHLWMKVSPLLFNRNIYSALLVGLAIIEYAKWVMSEIRDKEENETTGVIEASILFEKPRTNAEFIDILANECEALALIPVDAAQLIAAMAQRLGVEWPPPAPEVSDIEN